MANYIWDRWQKFYEPPARDQGTEVASGPVRPSRPPAAPVAPPLPESIRFLRIWDCAYEDPVKQVRYWKIVSGETRDEVMAEALRRTPADAHLTNIFRHDVEEVWNQSTGFTKWADEPYEWRPEYRPFKNVPDGEVFYKEWFGKFLGPYTRLDARHALTVKGESFEIDPWDDGRPSPD